MPPEHDGSIQQDEPDFSSGSDEAFLSRFAKDDAPVAARPPKADAEAPEAPEETEGDAPAHDKPADDADGKTESADPDDAEVEVKVGEEVKKAKLRDLKRLFGQEAALTQKSQRASELLKVAETERTATSARLEKLVAKAEEAYKPYADIDWLAVSQVMDPATFQQTRADAAFFKANVDYLKSEASSVMQEQQVAQQRAYTEAAKACIAVLESPETGIKGFGPELYGEIGTFAQTHGLDNFPAITNPGAIKVIHMAMEFERMQKAAKAAEAKTAKVINKATKVGKPGTAEATQPTAYADAMRSVKRNPGSMDAELALFDALTKRRA